MANIIKITKTKGQTSNIIHVPLENYSDASDKLLPGLGTGDLDIQYVKDHATGIAPATIQPVVSLGTYSSPDDNTMIRFGETFLSGIYELHLHDDWFVNSIGDSNTISIKEKGTSNVMDTIIWMELTNFDFYTDPATKSDLFPIIKNQPIANFTFPMLSGGLMQAGKTVTGTYVLDGAAPAIFSSGITEIGSGFYKIPVQAAETNADDIGYRFSATSCADTVFMFKPH